MGKTSKYKGVSWHKRKKMWMSCISDNGKHRHLGYFHSEEEAHEAWLLESSKIRNFQKVDFIDGEIWVNCSELGDDYFVSNKGRLKTINFNRTGLEALLKLTVSRNGYVRFSHGKRKIYSLHRLVASAFLGESDLYINHKDFNKQNNYVENLEYVTPRENVSYSLLKDNTFVGCYQRSDSGKWVAHYYSEGEQVYLGQFNTEQEAHQRYLDALKEQGITNRYVRAD